MKRSLFILLSVSLLVAGYFVYRTYLYREDVNPWQFVPSKAAIVVEETETLKLYDSLKSRQIWSAFSNLSGIRDWEEKLDELDSISTETIQELFGRNKTLLALFPVSVTDLDALYIMELNGQPNRSFLREVKLRWDKQGFRTKTRLYDGFTIEEFFTDRGSQMFSMIRHGDYLVGSYTPFLVEDAIRAFKEPEKFGFQISHPEVFRLKPLEQDEGNIFLNLNEFGELVKLFSGDNWGDFSGNGFLDIRVNKEFIKLSGFTMPKGGALTSFTSAPESFNLLDIIPDNVALLRHYSFSDAGSWRENLKAINPELTESSKKLKTELDLDMDFLFRQFGKEAAIADLEVIGADDSDRILFFDLANVAEVKQFLDLASVRTARDSVFRDQIGEYQIGKVDNDGFGSAFLGDLSALQGDSYYLFYQRYLILSNSISQLKKLIRSIENDNTWRKSIRINQLLDLSSREANASVIVNVPRFWNQMMRSMDEKWRNFFQANELGFKSLEHIAIQFNKVEDKFYTSIVALQSNPPRQPARAQLVDEATFSFNIISKAFLHRSHLNQSMEVLLQDSSYQLYHLSSQLDILWTKRLNDPIVGQIEALDYYQNEKKQYAFVAGSLLHIVDRTGKDIDGFPKALPVTSKVQHFSVIDYDGSKNYRFMCTAVNGKIYLLDKEGNALGGWNPNENRKLLIVAPEHIRIAGKDAFIFMTKDGLDLKTRRGGSYPGFPIEFNEDLRPGYFTQATGAFSTSKLTLVSTAGEILRINFSGKIEFRDQLYKPSLSASFDLISDVLDNTYLVTRFSGNEWEVLDGSGNLLFKKTYLESPPEDIKFYRFGGDNALVTVANQDMELLSIYDLKGSALTPSGLKTSTPPSILHFENQGYYEFYITTDNRLQRIRLK